MKERTFTIKNKLGLHARPAAQFAQEACKYKSRVLVSKDGVDVNGKSVMGLMLLAAECGSAVKVSAEGSDAEEALSGLGQLFERGFDEE